MDCLLIVEMIYTMHLDLFHRIDLHSDGFHSFPLYKKLRDVHLEMIHETFNPMEHQKVTLQEAHARTYGEVEA